MVEINLLPWRAKQKKYQEKVTKNLCCAAIITSMLFISGIHLYLSHELKNTQLQINHAQKILMESAGMLPTATKATSPANTIKKLAASQQEIIKIFMSLGERSPARVCLTAINRQQDLLIFTGNAYSNQDLTEFLLAFPMLGDLKIKQLQQRQQHLIQFQIETSANK
jgi:Tfp pilus assembly protein PilN